MAPFLLGGKDSETMCSDRTGREREGSGGAETAGCTPQIFLGYIHKFKMEQSLLLFKKASLLCVVL